LDHIIVQHYNRDAGKGWTIRMCVDAIYPRIFVCNYILGVWEHDVANAA
jgi:hypothetical protein